MLRSLFVPGWGQLYNGKWFKALVIGGTEIGFHDVGNDLDITNPDGGGVL